MICSVCKDDAFRFCIQCCTYQCNEHLCIHLQLTEVSFDEDIPTGQSFLSNKTILASISEEQLRRGLELHRSYALLLSSELESRLQGNSNSVNKFENHCIRKRGKFKNPSPLIHLASKQVLEAFRQIRKLAKKDKRVIDLLKEI
jgi:hypothetical protein